MALAVPSRKQLTLLKDDIVTVKSTVKSGKDLAQSEATVRKYLADTLYSDREKELQELLCDVLKKAYQVGNEKMYLKTKLDTTCLVKTGRRMFLAYQRMDSLDADIRPGDTATLSKIPSSRHKNSAYLLPYRTNIFMGGLYFMHRNEWKEAWDCFDMYLQCSLQPLFSQANLTGKDYISCKVAFLSLVAATKLDSLSYALKYADKSVISNQPDKALQMLAEITAKHKDSVRYEHYLKEGFEAYPKSEYFFPHLVDLLMTTCRDTIALALCDSAIAKDTLNTMFLLGRHGVLMDMHRYDEALTSGQKVLAVNDSLDIPNYNIGYIYHMWAMDALNKPGKPYRQRLQKAQKLLRKCRPYMEKYRALDPADRKLWRPILYDVYLNLNMGKEFAEIEKGG